MGAISIGIVLSVGAIPILIVLILRSRRREQHAEDPKKAALRHLRRFRTPTGGWHGTYNNKNHSKLALDYEESKEERTMTLVSFRDEALSVEEEEIGGGIVVDPNLFLVIVG